MGWALSVEGKPDPSGIVLLIDDKDEAESIAKDIRRTGIRIVIRPYPGRDMPTGFGSPKQP